MKEIAIVRLESYNGKWSESIIPSLRDQWELDYCETAKVETKQIEE